MTQSTSPMISYFSPRLAAHQVDVLRSVESHLTLAGSKEAGAEIRGSSLIELKSQLDSRFPQWKSSGVLDLYFRYQIMEETQRHQQDSAEHGIQILELLLQFMENELLDDVTAWTVIAELLETRTINDCKHLFGYLEQQMHRLVKDLVPGRGKALVFLRVCNDLLRRLSRCKDTSFCGKILTLLANVFPLGERSGVNVKGEYHTENVTIYEDRENLVHLSVGDDDIAKCSLKALETDIMPVYRVFWRLQDYFSQPPICLQKPHLENYRKCLDAVLKLFAEISRDNLTASNEKSVSTDAHLPFYPKYLTRSVLLPLELRDLTFRRTILVQALILHQFLVGSFSSKTPEKSQNEAELEWLKSIEKSCYDLLSRSGNDGERFASTIRNLLEREIHWIEWKANSCPKYEKDPEVVEAVKDLGSIPPYAPKYQLGSKEIERLWKHGDTDIDFSQHKNLNVPDLSEFLAPLREQLNPDDQIDKEYRLSNDMTYVWRCLRITSKHHLHLFQKVLHFDVEQLIQELDKDPNAIANGETDQGMENVANGEADQSMENVTNGDLEEDKTREPESSGMDGIESNDLGEDIDVPMSDSIKEDPSSQLASDAPTPDFNSTNHDADSPMLDDTEGNGSSGETNAEETKEDTEEQDLLA